MKGYRSIPAGLRPWTSPEGEVRYYVNDWFVRVKDVLDIYVKEEWNAPPMEKIKRTKVWFDSEGKVHVDRLKDELTREIIANNVIRSFS
jgi:hypothetical protein